MNPDIALILVQDGVVNGAVYALLALSLVLVFATTRVVFIAQGEFVAFGALTYAGLDSGQVPASLWLLGGLGLAAAACGLWQARAAQAGPRAAGWATRETAALLAQTVALPAAVIGATVMLAQHHPGVAANALLALAIVTPMAGYVYRIAFQPMAEASVLTLLIASVGVHMAMLGLGLAFFGPEGSRATGFSQSVVRMGALVVPGQAVWILGVATALMAGLYGFFGFTLLGAALRATAVNRLGARLVGIATARTGLIAFTLAGGIGALSGILVAPLTTIYYDSGFLIGLKGFTAAIMGGLASYPGAVLAAVLVGLVESFSLFWASALKEVIVFTAIIPVLLWRSLRHGVPEEEE